MKLIFAGTPSVAIPSLELLRHSKHEIACVLTRQDAPTGRKRVMTPSAVAEVAERLHIPVIKANSITGDVEHQLRDIQPDLGVVVAFGALLSSNVLSIPRLGWINLHFSALPQWRGAAPVQWELISGATSAHTSVFQLVEELDSGDVFSCESTAVYPFETAGALLNRLGRLGALNLAKVVDNIASGTASTVPQTGISTYARKLTLNDAKLDLHRTAEDVFNRFRGVTPSQVRGFLCWGVCLRCPLLLTSLNHPG